ncbi:MULTISPECIES: DUF4123 domain-containing protein [Lelliottia]|uniref:DUF4123 domain-containing protein n=1 Tax=Lelliottia aquatilis TaxID=2080838 RepID=A0ABX5A5R6_9ENTR|nr:MULTISPECIES: DUF4123 domain-containing protein [Lelliottia]POZ20689.1 DUF4123 domain-containing protein [Lelliottia aquatilis]POZ26068.1 DUF4123 domain-containing protein [Lelliottia aquatilis]POZ29224.1 DUF4123 domain-containing protein [Lelliottia sp. 7254-16]POZ33530.1 DUF4123 domain-containing protein [Lelliottia aquatilis]POZ39850.1 DUF4123 domain-containing protein [Lelliottia aquatilis]
MPLSQSFLIHDQTTHDQWLSTIGQGGCFILAESAINDAVPWQAERHSGNNELTRLYWDETGAIHASISPYIIPVNSDNWEQAKEYILTRDGWGIGIRLSWLDRIQSNEAQLKVLSQHLRSWLLVTTPEQDDVTLRLADWQVVRPLLEASTHPEATAFFGPVAEFWHLAPDGSAEKLELTHHTEHPSSITPPRTLSPLQWQAILTPSLLNTLQRYMAHLRQHHPRWHDAENNELQQFTEQHYQQALEYGFRHDRDIVRYLALASELLPGFIGDAWAQAIMRDAEYTPAGSRMDRLYSTAVEMMDNA